MTKFINVGVRTINLSKVQEVKFHHTSGNVTLELDDGSTVTGHLDVETVHRILGLDPRFVRANPGWWLAVAWEGEPGKVFPIIEFKVEGGEVVGVQTIWGFWEVEETDVYLEIVYDPRPQAPYTQEISYAIKRVQEALEKARARSQNLEKEKKNA